MSAHVAVAPGWRIYGLETTYGVAPALELELPPGVAREGALAEPPAHVTRALDGLPITAHRGRVAFGQRLRLEATPGGGVEDGARALEATFRWQVCDEGDRLCAPGARTATVVLPDARGEAPGRWTVGADPRVSVEVGVFVRRDLGGARLPAAGGGLTVEAALEPAPDWRVVEATLEVLPPAGVRAGRTWSTALPARRALARPSAPGDDAPGGAADGPSGPAAGGALAPDARGDAARDDAAREVGVHLARDGAHPGGPAWVVVRWRARTALGTPGEGVACASLPLPPARGGP